jgi:ABC-type phosphate transport system substrate-binding protein
MVKNKFFSLVFGTLLLAQTSIAANVSTAPIVRTFAPVTVLTSDQLKAIFLLSIPRWDDGTKITVIIMHQESNIQRRFFFDYFGLTPSRYVELINAKVFTGRASHPTIVTTETEMVKLVGRTVGSIGFIGSTIYIGDRDSVKVLNIKN